jgi:hypothetical protein
MKESDELIRLVLSVRYVIWEARVWVVHLLIVLDDDLA